MLPASHNRTCAPPALALIIPRPGSRAWLCTGALCIGRRGWRKAAVFDRTRGKVYSQPRKSLLTIFSTPAEKRGKVAPARTSGPQASKGAGCGRRTFRLRQIAGLRRILQF